MQQITFKNYLENIGCEIIDIKGDWGTSRFVANNIVCVVYRNSKGNTSFSSETALKIYNAWLNNKK